ARRRRHARVVGLLPAGRRRRDAHDPRRGHGTVRPPGAAVRRRRAAAVGSITAAAAAAADSDSAAAAAAADSPASRRRAAAAAAAPLRRGLLDRDADPGGRDATVAAVRAGQRAARAADIVLSPEYRGNNP